MTSAPTPAALLPDETPFAWARMGKHKWFFRYSAPTAQSEDGWFPVYRSRRAADRRPSPPPSGDLEAQLRELCNPLAERMSDTERLTAFVHAAVEAADLLASQAQTITQERELRKAAEGERDDLLECLADLDAAEIALRETVAAGGSLIDAEDRIGEAISIAVKARRALNANDQGTNDGR